MDNTILKSSIDFQGMKEETYRLLVKRGILPNHLPLAVHTTATIIKTAIETKLMNQQLIDEMWEIPKRFETAGMEFAELEAGVTELLSELQGQYYLAIVTNNSIAAAVAALRGHHIFDYFNIVIGREYMNGMKPSPDGFHAVLDSYEHVPAREWLSVGDAWIDGAASEAAGIPFVAYNADTEKMAQMGVRPIAHIHDIRELRQLL
ncbi:HAD family hydrolase [Paenibacillus sp. SCIV0701]|uniref:HAD family hydrolase n=2 Tax=Paenibacillus soyae TaxID=2969249 RepID=A0A9X2MN59_9BACL|nr:HAD family hydrolase [Paenibacillus soyae]MCR2802788.1 HAD family hydrolase [Paenibacillus soyae]